MNSSQFPVLSSQRSSSQLPALASQENLAGRGVWRWLKFNFVGGIGIGVQLAALVLFRSLLHLDYLLATALAVETAVVHNFFWHERFTWADRPATHFVHSLIRLVKFNISNGGVSIVGNLLLMRLLVGELRLNYLVANLIAIAVCSLVNFLLSDRFVFERKADGRNLG
jgi:putative flippase GtrA